MPAKPFDYPAEMLLQLLAYLETGAELDGYAFTQSGLREHGIPWSAAGIVGHEPSRAECRACLRTAAAAEQSGLIEQVAAGTTNRTTHIRLTAAGLAEAIRLTEGQADATAIAASLERTSWGAQLAAGLKGSSPKKRRPTNGKRTNQAAGRQTEADAIATPTAPDSIAGPPAESPCPSSIKDPTP